MPQITLDYTANVNLGDVQVLVAQIHDLLTERLPTSLDNCRTRVVCHETYRVGDGAPDKGFVHLRIDILKGRSLELRTAVGEALLELLKASLSQPGVAITLALGELPDVYCRG